MMTERKNTGMRLRPESVAKLDAAAARMGDKSRAFVVEVLIGLYADGLNADTRIPAGVCPAGTRERSGRPAPPGRPRKAAADADGPAVGEPAPDAAETKPSRRRGKGKGK